MALAASLAVPLSDDTDLEEESACGPINPPSHVGSIGLGNGGGSPPRIIAWQAATPSTRWAGFKGGIYVATVSGNNRRKITTFTHHNR